MNEDHSEKILESFLEEMLTQKHPPDLTERIKAAWQAEQATTGQDDQRVVAELVDAEVVETDVIPLTNGNPVNESGLSAPSGSIARKVRSRRGAPKTVLLQSILDVSAAVAVGLLGWTLINNSTSPSNLEANNSEGLPTPEQELAINTLEEQEVVESDLIAETSKDDTQESVDFGKLPFDRSPNETQIARTQVVKRSLPPKLDDDAILKLVDAKLDELWARVDVSPTSTLDDSALVSKARIALLGEFSKQFSYQSPAAADFDRDVEQILASQQFSRALAHRFVKTWSPRPRTDPESDDLRAVTEQVAQRVRSGEWNEIVVDLLGGTVETGKSANQFLTAMAGAGNHRLVRRIGTHFLNENLRCVRCHDSETKSEYDEFTDQGEYWSLVALLRGVDIDRATEQPSRLVDKQETLFRNGAPKVYFERPNGELKLAQAVLPDGSSWQASPDSLLPRRELAKWISQSAQLDRATVNQVWQFFVGRPLVPHQETIDAVGISVRREILETLAGQFAASGHDIRKLVGWIVRSRAFSRDALDFSHEQWLVASREDLDRIRLAQKVFAIGEDTAQPVRSLDGALQMAVRLRNSSEANRNVFAQPDTRKLAPKNGNPRSDPQSSESNEADNIPIDFALGTERPTTAEAAYLQRLVDADSLTWESRVAHVVDLHEVYFQTGRIKQLANQLLSSHNGDQYAALIDLMWAVDSAGVM